MKNMLSRNPRSQPLLRNFYFFDKLVAISSVFQTGATIYLQNKLEIEVFSIAYSPSTDQGKSSRLLFFEFVRTSGVCSLVSFAECMWLATHWKSLLYAECRKIWKHRWMMQPQCCRFKLGNRIYHTQFVSSYVIIWIGGIVNYAIILIFCRANLARCHSLYSSYLANDTQYC